MNSKRLRPLLAILAVAVPLQAAAVASATQVGFAVRDITPSGNLNGICLGGYGACICRQATGVNDHIYARAMVITVSMPDGPRTIAIESLDLIGASNRVLKSIISRVNSPNRILPDENIIIAEIHSHSTPDLVGLWGKVPDEYKRFVTAQAEAAIRDAFERRAPAVLQASVGSYSENVNRRSWDGTDQALVVLDATRADNGKRIGTLINYAAHPTIFSFFNTLISRDWVGYMVDRVEATLGASTVMLMQGAQGDVSPRMDVTGGATEHERARNYGQAVGDAVLKLMASAPPLRVDDSLKLSRTTFTQCMTNPFFLAAGALGCMDYDLDCGALSCPWSGPLSPLVASTQVALLRLGTQIQVAIVPGEMLTRMAIDGVGARGLPASTGGVKPVMKAPVKMVFSMATDFYGYLVPQDEWNSPRRRKNPANAEREEISSLGGDQANTWLRDRVKALIVEDNATFEPARPALSHRSE